MLPDGFNWRPRYQNAPPGELVLLCGDLGVAQLMQKTTGEWYAMLSPFAEPMSPFRRRDCTSRESGIVGIEAWAALHVDRLRAQALIHSRRKTLRRHPAVSRGPVVGAEQAGVEGAVGDVENAVSGQVD